MSRVLPSGSRPKVTVLMATYQGAAYLPEQLASLRAQKDVDWLLWASDDGSHDGTWALLEDFRSEMPHAVRLLRGPGQGAATNFLSLLCHPDLPVGPVALADQDDVWAPDKLIRALAHLKGTEGPAVYTARSRHVDADGTPLGASRELRGPTDFGNAQVENKVSGHAAVLNAAGLALVRRVGPVSVPFHDWWLYLLITGAGGQVICDQTQVLDYRQHGRNVLGARRSLMAGVRRAALVLSRVGQDWITANRAALMHAQPYLSQEARSSLAALTTAPHAGLGRVRQLRRLGVTRHERPAQALIWLAAMLGRL